MQPATPQDSHIVTLEAQPGQPVVGVGTFAITILDPAGKPVEGAQLTVEGNMSHAGMIPSAGTVMASQGGRYTIALDWTMAGAWYVDVKATLPDGRSIVRRFPVNVRAAK